MNNTQQQIQREIAILGAVTNELRKVDERILRQIETEQGAYRACIAHSPVHRSDESWADLIGVSRAVFNRCKNGDGYRVNYSLPRVKQEDLQKGAQNTAIDQWARLYRDGQLNCQRTKQDEIAELRTRLAVLESGE